MNNLTFNINLDMNKNISSQYVNTLNETKQPQPSTSTPSTNQLLLYQFDSTRSLPSSSSSHTYFSNSQFDTTSNHINNNSNNVVPVKLLVQINYKFIDQNQPHYQHANF